MRQSGEGIDCEEVAHPPYDLLRGIGRGSGEGSLPAGVVVGYGLDVCDGCIVLDGGAQLYGIKSLREFSGLTLEFCTTSIISVLPDFDLYC